MERVQKKTRIRIKLFLVNRITSSPWAVMLSWHLGNCPGGFSGEISEANLHRNVNGGCQDPMQDYGSLYVEQL